MCARCLRGPEGGGWGGEGGGGREGRKVVRVLNGIFLPEHTQLRQAMRLSGLVYLLPLSVTVNVTALVSLCVVSEIHV